MKDHVYSGELDMQTLQTVVHKLRLDAEFGILESVTDIEFPVPNQENIVVGEWNKGRIFNEIFEMRWEQLNGTYRTVLAGEERYKSPEELTASDSFNRPEQLSIYFCWNETNPRLGRTLDYRCVPGEGEVQLSVYEYRDDRGRLVFWRYTNLARVGDRL